MTLLQQLEASITSVATEAAESPTGGMAAYLNANPLVAAFYFMGITAAHAYLTKLEGGTPAASVSITGSAG